MLKVHILKSENDAVRTKAALASSNMWDFTAYSNVQVTSTLKRQERLSFWGSGLQVSSYIAEV